MVVGCIRGSLMEMDFTKVEIRWGNWEKMADVSTRGAQLRAAAAEGRADEAVEDASPVKSRGDLRRPCITVGPRVPLRYTFLAAPLRT